LVVISEQVLGWIVGSILWLRIAEVGRLRLGCVRAHLEVAHLLVNLLFVPLEELAHLGFSLENLAFVEVALVS